MKSLSLSASVALTVVGSAMAQTAPGFSQMPIPEYIIENNPLSTPPSAPGNTIESVQHLKLSNNADGVWTTALTLGALEAAYGGNGLSTGVFIGIFDPYNQAFSRTTEANALNSTSNDKHLSLSQDGLWAIFERTDAQGTTTVQLASRNAVGTAFGVPTTVSGFPASSLPLGEYTPYLGKVGGADMCFYADGTNLLMQPINLAGATLTGQATIIANTLQGGQPAAPSPIHGADGDAEAIWATEIIFTSPGGAVQGDADPTWHDDLDPSTAPVIKPQRPDWQGWGSAAGGFLYFCHDSTTLPMHVMHAETAILLGDTVPAAGGQVDITTMGVNYGSPLSLDGYILFGTGVGMGVQIPPFRDMFALQNPVSVILQTSTTSKDGVASISFALSPNPSLAGLSVPMQALLVDQGAPRATWTNTAHLKFQ